MKLRLRIDSAIEKLRRGMIVPVKLFVNFRAPQTKIGAQIDNHLTGSAEREGILRSNSVGQSKKDNVDIGPRSERIRRNVLKLEVPYR
jgi:hypothetical protein